MIQSIKNFIQEVLPLTVAFTVSLGTIAVAKFGISKLTDAVLGKKYIFQCFRCPGRPNILIELRTKNPLNIADNDIEANFQDKSSSNSGTSNFNSRYSHQSYTNSDSFCSPS